MGVRPGLVHRLDRDTSGLMVVAKTDAHSRTCLISFAIERFTNLTSRWSMAAWRQIQERSISR